MKLWRFLIVIAVMLCPIFSSFPVYASGIGLDGDFEDWDDKPELNDPMGDEIPSKDIVLVKWHPDAGEGNVYFYCERSARSDKKDKKNEEKELEDEYGIYDENFDENEHGDNDIYNDVRNNYLNNNMRFAYWVFYVNFLSELGKRQARVFYHPPSRRVVVLLFGAQNELLWSAHGKWGDKKNIARRVEFYVPVSYLAVSIQSGFSVDLFYLSGRDRAPDSGFITISTISTFPYATVMVLSILTITGAYFAKRKTAKGKEA